VPESYDAFAPHFDAWQRAFGGAYDDLILPRILAALARHPRPVRRVVDLGIGTGDLVVALARAGYAVIGVDRSAAMLDVARGKIAAADLAAPPLLVHQDLRALRLDEPTDAAISVYTVINQLTADGDLLRAMSAVHDALAPGGLFCFELNLLEAYERYWTGLEQVTLPDAVVVREHRRDGATFEARVTIRRSDGTTIHDRIAQRLYDDGEVAAALAGAGFELVGVERFDPFTTAGSPVKVLWSAQRTRA
jgi:SAM-dependent methyltransferase